MATNQAYYGEYVATQPRQLIKAGNLTINFTKCPFQFQVTDEKTAPAFFAHDGTSCYYGAIGYYRSIPAWRPFAGNYSLVQSATFNITSAGIFENISLLPNPFVYEPFALENSYELQMPAFMSANSAPTAAVPGFTGIFCTTSRFFNLGGSAVHEKIQRWQIPNNPIDPASHIYPAGAATTLAVTASPIAKAISSNVTVPFLLQDDFLQEHIIDKQFTLFEDENNNEFKCGTIWGDYQGNGVFPSYNTIYKWGAARCIDTMSAAFPGQPQSAFNWIKVNPVTGNALGYGDAALVGGGRINGVVSTNVFAPGQFAPGQTVTQFTPVLLNVNSEDAVAWSELSINRGTIIVPGGGFLCVVNSSPNGFLVNDAGTEYYSVNFNWPDGQPAQYGAVGIDLNGNIYVIQPTNSANPTLYWTGGSPLKINIALASLPRWGVSCQPFDPCAA